ncbi:hypothetical protein SESBI_33249 [Sesbania bispinosa]|nr:hypothetical protein SESBI_33249 [Sesbania bispinosa]
MSLPHARDLNFSARVYEIRRKRERATHLHSTGSRHQRRVTVGGGCRGDHNSDGAVRAGQGRRQGGGAPRADANAVVTLTARTSAAGRAEPRPAGELQ